MHLCLSGDGVTIRLGDLKLEAKVERMLTLWANLALREVLGQALKRVALVQWGRASSRRRRPRSPTSPALPTYGVEAVPILEPNPDGQW